jgi:hypothetical protein
VKGLGLAMLLAAAAQADELRRVEAGDLCVTRGSVAGLADGRLRVAAPTVRAVVPGTDGDRVELRFVYLGPTQQTAPLGSGELRRQIGVKLRAQDGCNLLYVMWRIEPHPGIVVSVKRNSGQRTHAECKNRGYRNLPGDGTQPGPIVPGTSHTLTATLADTTLRVFADGVLAWHGDVGPDALALVGPVGVRSDNGRFDLELRAPRRAAATGGCARVDEE